MTQPPDLPDGITIQFTNLSTGWVYRVADDGRFLVTPTGGPEAQQPPLSKLDGGPVVTEQGMSRLKAAVERCDFFALPDHVQSDVAVHTDPESEAEAQDVAFTVRGADGPKTVRVHGALAQPATLGALEPLYAALDEEALGGWANE